MRPRAEGEPGAEDESTRQAEGGGGEEQSAGSPREEPEESGQFFEHGWRNCT